MSDVLSKEQIAAIDRRERGIPQAHEMARVLDSHEAFRLRAETAEAEVVRLRGQTCAACRFAREDRPACDKGVVVTFGPAFGGYNHKVDFGCNQWAARDTASPEGETL